MTNQTIFNQWKPVLLLIFLLSAFNSNAKEYGFNAPIISIPDTVEVCRFDSGIDSTCINFNGFVDGVSGTWNQDNIIPSFNFGEFSLDSVCFEGIQTGCYSFTFTTDTASLPYFDMMVSMIVCVKACPCPSPATIKIPDICTPATYNLQFAELTADSGTWSVISGPATQDISGIITDKIFDATDILSGLYVVRFTLDNPGNMNCDTFSEQSINVIEQEQIFAIDTGQLCIIEGQQFPTTLDLFSLINVDASNGGTWTQTGTETSIPIIGGSIISSEGITDFSQTFTFEYLFWDISGPCPPIVVEVIVNINVCCPVISVASDTLCNDGMPIDLSTLLTNDSNLSGTWTTSGNLVGTSMFDPFGLLSGAYNVTYTLDSIPDPNCESEYPNIIIVRKKPVADAIDGPQPCSADTGNGPTAVNLYDWLASGYSGGSWAQTGGLTLPISDDEFDMAIVDFVGQNIGESFTFVYTTFGAEEPCTNISVEIIITVIDCNCPLIELSIPSPIINDDGILDMCGLIGASDPGTFTVLNEFGEDQSVNIDSAGCIFNTTDLAPGTYAIIYTLDVQVPSICVQSDTVFLEVLEAVSTNSIVKDNIQIYPNPSSELLRIKSDFTITSLSLYTSTGSSIYRIQSLKSNDVELNLSPYPTGLYLLQVETDKGTWIEKVIRK